MLAGFVARLAWLRAWVDRAVAARVVGVAVRILAGSSSSDAEGIAQVAERLAESVLTAGPSGRGSRLL